MNEATKSHCTNDGDSKLTQFSIVAALKLTVFAAVSFSVWLEFSRECKWALEFVPGRTGWALAISMSLWIVVTLAIVSKSLATLRRGHFGNRFLMEMFSDDAGDSANFRPQILGLRPRLQQPSLKTGMQIGFVTMALFIGLWPVIRELAVVLNLSIVWGVSEAWAWTRLNFLKSLGSLEFWMRQWTWELWSLGRWWILFGLITAAWSLVSFPFQKLRARRYASDLFARLLCFAPWIIVLELSYLFGTWVGGANTVPEPNTGFVVGIFDWELWHWNCWRDERWLRRAAVPTILAGYMFFRAVLHWWRIPSAILSILLVPIAICLSIATTVAFQNGLP